ncbi:MAG: hypothetical protein WC747_01060 [Candidatus Babeliales bacterium]|jgi:hypothetical protein
MYKFIPKNLTHIIETSKDEQVKKLCKNYCWNLIIFLIVFGLIDIIRLFFMVTNISYKHEFFRLLSIIFGVIAIAGNPGWKIQSWAGENPVEKWNNWIILILVSISGFISMFL